MGGNQIVQSDAFRVVWCPCCTIPTGPSALCKGSEDALAPCQDVPAVGPARGVDELQVKIRMGVVECINSWWKQEVVSKGPFQQHTHPGKAALGLKLMVRPGYACRRNTSACNAFMPVITLAQQSRCLWDVSTAALLSTS